MHSQVWWNLVAWTETISPQFGTSPLLCCYTRLTEEGCDSDHTGTSTSVLCGFWCVTSCLLLSWGSLDSEVAALLLEDSNGPVTGLWCLQQESGRHFLLQLEECACVGFPPLLCLAANTPIPWCCVQDSICQPSQSAHELKKQVE